MLLMIHFTMMVHHQACALRRLVMNLKRRLLILATLLLILTLRAQWRERHPLSVPRSVAEELADSHRWILTFLGPKERGSPELLPGWQILPA